MQVFKQQLSFILLLLCLLSVVYPFNFNFGLWEHCYDDSVNDLFNIDNINLRVVQSPNHLLGFQIYVNINSTVNMNNILFNTRLWHQETGDRYKYGDYDACLIFCKDDNCNSNNNENINCINEGLNEGMIEYLFVEEHYGHFEVEIQIINTSNEIREEIGCIAIPFEISESFLTQFQNERSEKVQKQQELLLLFLIYFSYFIYL